MPELPEVEVWRRLLQTWIGSDAIEEVAITDPDLLEPCAREEAAALLPNRSVEGLQRLGKCLLWDQPKRPTLGIHLRMTGGWVRSPPGAPPPPASRAQWRLESGACIHFTDVRRLARWYWGGAEEVREAMGVHELGPDALAELPSATALQERMRRKRSLKSAMMDQRVLAGIGNIAASEICFRARLSPWIRPSDMTEEQWGSIRTQIRCQLEESIARDEGAAIVYVSAGGDNPFAVYGREGEPCPTCSHPIERRAQSGRSTFFCPSCQGTG